MHDLTDLAMNSPLSAADLQYIETTLNGTGVFTGETVREQIEWFVRDLGINDYYFRTTPVDEIARQILALGASELVSRHGGDGVTIQLISEESNRATYIVEDTPRRTREVETRIEERYPSFRLESYRARSLPDGTALRFYITTRPEYPETESHGFETAATTDFLERSLPETLQRYRNVWNLMNERIAPVIHITEKDDTNEQRIMLGIHGSGSRFILSAFTQLFASMDLPLRRRYIEPFRDGTYVLTFYTHQLTAGQTETLAQELNAVAMLPRSGVSDLFFIHGCPARETMYAIAASAFAHQFVSELAEGYHILRDAVAANPEAKGILASLKSNFTKNTFSTSRIAETVLAHASAVALLFQHFTALHGGAAGTAGNGKVGGSADPAEIRGQIEALFDRDVPYHRDRTILTYFLTFNELVHRTNFFRDDKAALSFSLNGGFLDSEDFPEDPFGVFFMVGRQFTGFHVRFRDIARGGIRIVRSRTADAWSRNVDTIFEENYNLASTQQRKNKDIPEGGSKGIILMNPEAAATAASAENAFRGYVDALLDLIVPREVSDEGTVSDPPDVLFLGPDEGSAELMDWAALHARERGYPFWKGFTTGKSLSLGGVPHDRYGMTTRSVHTYARLLLEKLGLQEESVRKIQTGGPDGDLGSNEILVSTDKTVAVVDGSGVAYDPAGLDRTELTRLARARLPIGEFARERLGEGGFFVGVDDRDITLPDGSTHANGEEFRNRFHLSPYMEADLFVPCGGRPSAINVANWTNLLREDGTPRIRAIVEGANLFITQEARLRLEERGVLLFKDASTNKGGVTSSSLEVYAGLAMSDEEFTTHMTVPEAGGGGSGAGAIARDRAASGPGAGAVAASTGAEPEFRRRYVEAVIQRIEANAAAEFELLWSERERDPRPLTIISDEISARITRITDAVSNSDYLSDPLVRRTVVAEYTPLPLLELIGLEALLERVPESYVDAIVAARIGSRFVYRAGLTATEVDFARYMDELRGAAQ